MSKKRKRTAPHSALDLPEFASRRLTEETENSAGPQDPEAYDQKPLPAKSEFDSYDGSIASDPPLSKKKQAAKARFGFSDAAKLAMDRARHLAAEAKRAALDSSCLLFGLAENLSSAGDTASFVKDQMSRGGNYQKILREFQNDASDSISHEEVLGVGMVSPNVAYILEQAADFAEQTSGKARVIHQRHLLAALLQVPPERNPSAFRWMTAAGLKVPSAKADFRELLRRVTPSETQWDGILISSTQEFPVTTSDPFNGPAGFTPEVVRLGRDGAVPDHLNVQAWANRLADLVALKETKLPLAVGLFGNWGSGKSHFMNLMDRRLRILSADSRQHSPWCREIVPIYFSAWHYLDANLWASLITQIFESLFNHLRQKKDDLAEVEKLLKQASGAASRAAEELVIAQEETRRAENDLTEAVEEKREKKESANAIAARLKTLLTEGDQFERAKQIADLLDIKEAPQTIDALRDALQQAQSIRGRLRKLWKKMMKQPGRSWRLGWIATTLIAMPLLAILAVRARRVLVVPAGIMSLLVTSLSWITPILLKVDRELKKADQLADEAVKAQEDASQMPEVIEAKRNLSLAASAEQAANLKLAQAQAHEKQLEEEARNLSPERRIGRFIEERANSSDYRGQLGVVSLARRDFEMLSELFSDVEVFKERLNQQTPGGVDQARVQRIDNLSRSVDRIVLFIDDLDRCHPAKVGSTT